MSKNKINSPDSFQFAQDVINSLKNERFLKKSSGLQKSYQKVFISFIEVAQMISDSGFHNKHYGDFLIQQAKILNEMGKNIKGQK